MYFYNAKNSLRAGAGIVLKSLEGIIFKHCLRLNFPITNNKAEYEAFIAGLQFTSKLKVLKLYNFNDSKLVVNQVTGKFKTQGAKLAKYLAITKTLLIEFREIKIV